MSKCISFTPRQAERRSLRSPGGYRLSTAQASFKNLIYYTSVPPPCQCLGQFFSRPGTVIAEILVNHNKLFLTLKQFCNILLMTFGEERETHAFRTNGWAAPPGGRTAAGRDAARGRPGGCHRHRGHGRAGAAQKQFQGVQGAANPLAGRHHGYFIQERQLVQGSLWQIYRLCDDPIRHRGGRD